MVLFGTLYTKKQALRELQSDDNATINAKNRRIRSLEIENEALNSKVIELVQTMTELNVGSREDKLIQMAEKWLPTLLLSKPAINVNSTEASRRYSDDEIKTILLRVERAGALPKLVKLGEKEFINQAIKKIPDSTREDGERAYKLGVEMLNNGITRQNQGTTSGEEREPRGEERGQANEPSREEREPSGEERGQTRLQDSETQY